MDETGELTPAGEYYYEKTALAPPNPGPGAFNPHQEPTKRGQRYHIQMLDGKKAVVRTFDPVKKEGRFTRTGKILRAKPGQIHGDLPGY